MDPDRRDASADSRSGAVVGSSTFVSPEGYAEICPELDHQLVSKGASSLAICAPLGSVYLGLPAEGQSSEVSHLVGATCTAMYQRDVLTSL